jgi:Transglutaminase-like superfamily
LIRRKWATFRSLSPSEQRLFFHAAALLPLTVIGLKLFGFRRWRSVLQTLEPAGSHSVDGAPGDRIRSIVRMVRLAASRGPFSPTCLPRSLVLSALLRREGFDARLCIGSRKHGEGLGAHAWVEYQGVAVGEDEDVQTRFTPFEPVTTPDR